MSKFPTPEGFEADAVRDLVYVPALLAGLTVREADREPGFEEGNGGIWSGVWLNLFTRSFNNDCLCLVVAERIGFDFVELNGESLFDDMDEDRYDDGGLVREGGGE